MGVTLFLSGAGSHFLLGSNTHSLLGGVKKALRLLGNRDFPWLLHLRLIMWKGIQVCVLGR